MDFLGNKEKYGTLWVLEKEEEGIFSLEIFFGGGRTKVGDLKMKMEGTFPGGINNCLI